MQQNANPTIAKAWMTSNESISEYMGCCEEHKIHCAIFKLRGAALLLWQSTKRVIGAGGNPITWEHFKAEFLDK